MSYFSAEVTRGIWKPAFMNGTDWPSPAANLSNVEEQIKKILAATGVDIPSLAAGYVLVYTYISFEPFCYWCRRQSMSFYFPCQKTHHYYLFTLSYNTMNNLALKNFSLEFQLIPIECNL